MSCQALGSGLGAGRSVVSAFVGLSVLWAAVRVSSQTDSDAGEGELGCSYCVQNPTFLPLCRKMCE